MLNGVYMKTKFVAAFYNELKFHNPLTGKIRKTTLPDDSTFQWIKSQQKGLLNNADFFQKILFKRLRMLIIYYICDSNDKYPKSVFTEIWTFWLFDKLSFIVLKQF